MGSQAEQRGVSHFAPLAAPAELVEPTVTSSSWGAATSGLVRLDESGYGRLVKESPGALETRHFLRILRTALPLVVADALTILLALVLAAVATDFIADVQYTRLHKQSLTLLALLCVVFPQFGLYPGPGLNPILELRQLVVSTTLAYLLLFIANTSFGRLSEVELIFLCLAWGLSLAMLPITRRMARSLLCRFKWWGQSALIIGSGPQGTRIYEALRASPGVGLRPVGVVDELHRHWSETGEPSAPYLGPPSDLAAITEQYDAQWAIVATSECSASDLPHIFDQCAWCIPNLLVVPNIDGVPSLWSRLQECAGQPGIHVHARLLLPLPRLIKRLMDIVLTIAGSVLSLPLIAGIAVLIRISSPGPVFYPHIRIGLNGRRFHAWKFRTMVPDADAILADWLEKHPEARIEWELNHKLRDDPRIIPGIGYYLRQFSLDEIPQLWNVLRGEMSLVGPRPIVTGEIEKYEGSFHLYLKVPPGMTGLWQVSGRNDTTYEERVRLDTYYVRNWSPWLDLYILVRTIKTVLLQEGAY